MPRAKKIEDPKKRSKKQDEVIEDDEIIDEADEVGSVKNSKKSKSKSVPSKKSKERSRNDSEDEVDDELSDIEMEDETPQNEGSENDEVVRTGPRSHSRPQKLIDPKSTIGDLKTEDILSYLIQVGDTTLNPQLKYGALNLLRDLTGKSRRPRPRPEFGSKRCGFGRSDRGGRNGYGGDRNGDRGGRNGYGGDHGPNPNFGNSGNGYQQGGNGGGYRREGAGQDFRRYREDSSSQDHSRDTRDRGNRRDRPRVPDETDPYADSA